MADAVEGSEKISPYAWIRANNLWVPGGYYDRESHMYQIDMLQDVLRLQLPDGKPIRTCAIKGAQMAFTTTEIIKKLHGLIFHLYPQGVMCLFPTLALIRRFSQSRFKPIIDMNPFIGQHVSGEIDNVELKRVGGANLYFVGAKRTTRIEGQQASSAALKSEPVDSLLFDEYDEMDEQMVQLAKNRLDHSRVKEETYLSTPSIPDFGIDRMYEVESDRRVWVLWCPKCGSHTTCLELEFPDCIQKDRHGVTHRVCVRCRQTILDPRFGAWEVRDAGKSDDMHGWYISQLCSRYVDPGVILKEFLNPPNNDLGMVYNNRLGRAYIAAENRLTVHDIYGCCTDELMALQHHGPAAMGVDVKGEGNPLHVVVGIRTDEKRVKVIWIGRVGTFSDVKDVGSRFNVKSCVVDYGPETRAAREFQREVPWETFLCQYRETQRGNPAFDSKEGLATVNRTEACDATHNLVVNGHLLLFRKTEELRQYAVEMSNLAKVLEEDPETHSRHYFYRPVGTKRDDYRHATNYLWLAASRIGVAPRGTPRGKGGKKDGWAGEFDNRPEPEVPANWMAW